MSHLTDEETEDYTTNNETYHFYHAKHARFQYLFLKNLFGVLHLIYVKLAELPDIHLELFLLRIKNNLSR